MCDVPVLWSLVLNVCALKMGEAGLRPIRWTMASLNSKSAPFYSGVLIFVVVLMAYLPTSLEQDEDIPHNE
jgi:hypothetical protein